MKLNRLIAMSAVGISLLTTPTSVFASPSFSLLSIFSPTDTEKASKRQSDMNGQNTGRGHNCDNGKGNGGGYCGTGTPTPAPPPPPPVGPKG
jgi:hypothetical protein